MKKYFHHMFASLLILTFFSIIVTSVFFSMFFQNLTEVGLSTFSSISSIQFVVLGISFAISIVTYDKSFY